MMEFIACSNDQKFRGNTNFKTYGLVNLSVAKLFF